MPILKSNQQALLGCTLGNRYLIDRALGTGAMGTVYRAQQIETGAWVAVKVLHPHLATDPGLVLRFEREAFATARLDHPNALRVLDFGEDDDLFYLVTEYVEAANLLSVLEAEWPLSDERVVSILSQVLSALVAVHEVGIVHRDLKPENILVLSDQNDDGEKIDVVKVCDFGIAKIARPAPSRKRPFTPRLTAEGTMVGTPDYMSPEQARGQGVDGRSDLYSVGVILYHMLAGRTPFNADTAVGLALQHLSDAPVPPSRHRQVHRGLEAVCLRALSKRPEDRFQSARQMRKGLRDALKASPRETALVPGWIAALRAGSSFSTSSAAMVPVRHSRQALARSGIRDHERRRRRVSIGYAAVASVATLSASAWVARQSASLGLSGSIERVRATALVSPPSLPATPAVHAPAPEEEHGVPIAPSGPATSLATLSTSPPWAPPVRRPVTRGRPAPAPKSRPRSVVAVAPPALPTAPEPAATATPVLVRSEPWANRPDAPESTQLIVATPVPPELRGGIDPHSWAPAHSETAPAPLDWSYAAVSVDNVVTSAGISHAKVKVALAHVPLSSCYQQAMRSRPFDAPFDAELRLTIDVAGRIVDAALSRDGNLPGLRGCFDAVLRLAQVRDVAAGEGSATAQLRFSPR